MPTAPLIDSLRALRQAFPDLPVSFSTEGVGGAERRLRADAASLAFCLLLPSVPDDLMAYPLMDLKLMPVAAAEHPLAHLRRTLDRTDLEAHVQLVLSDAVGVSGPSYGIVGNRVWRFACAVGRWAERETGFWKISESAWSTQAEFRRCIRDY